MKLVKIFLIVISLLLFQQCITIMGWKCVNECKNNSGEYTSGVNDKYIGPTAISPKLSKNIFFFGNIFPIGKGKLIYGEETPGSKRAFRDTGDSYEGDFGWDDAGMYSVYSGEGTYTTANGTVTKTFWEKDFVKIGAPVEKKLVNGRIIKGIFEVKDLLCEGNCVDGYGLETMGKDDFFKVGDFKNSKLNGNGSFFNGLVYLKGKFKDDLLVEGHVFCMKTNANFCLYLTENYRNNPLYQNKGYLSVKNVPRE
ncbi:hypothetical protein EHQ16_11240 [Leptospira kanakyensis]|uniref:MORN repeat protein n=1 Tax=Leptospira kanakyensis TaxID=2484968 RepID=A0A6N4Q8D8_9LEPT|nr:hypothetical protein [Leptospira kanakyensis]TGK54351.1 hypothetical protein EHQ11_01995 [Leptospira kanakyensis]TGK58929.1 hypothetical protein EHQ16_11240 [Leptospira kanakyensis]TGK75330.1 hypothetical protein EHQ18_03295 [Leptospira kanakyensis]